MLPPDHEISRADEILARITSSWQGATALLRAMKEPLPDNAKAGASSSSHTPSPPEALSIEGDARVTAQENIDAPGQEPEVPCYLAGALVSAFPDMGAAANFISHKYAQRHALRVNCQETILIKKANGTVLSTLGTVMVPFSFAGESWKHHLEFHVLRRSLYDVILGAPFLRATKTFTEFAHRISHRIRRVMRPARACFLGAANQRMSGWLAGERADALPDTGSDISLISSAYAEERGFAIDTADCRRKTVQFVDGSMAETLGILEDVEWRFQSGTERIHRAEFCVIKDLPVDVLFSYDFLRTTNAFVAHGDAFSDIDESDAEGPQWGDSWMLNVIKIVRTSRFRRLRELLSGRKGGSPADPDPGQLRRAQEIKELDELEAALMSIMALPEEQRAQALAAYQRSGSEIT